VSVSRIPYVGYKSNIAIRTELWLVANTRKNPNGFSGVSPQHLLTWWQHHQNQLLVEVHYALNRRKHREYALLPGVATQGLRTRND